MQTNPESQLKIALSRLEGVKDVKGGYEAKCPAHKDRVQSLSLREEKGKLLMYCHAGCTFQDIVSALDLPPLKSEVVQTVEVACYDYTNASGTILYQVVRYEPKDFRQRRPDGKGGWEWGRNGIKPTLFNLPKVMETKAINNFILFVEGEKDVLNLAKLGITATTMAGGASSKWQPEYTAILSGAKVCIIPDNDEPGRAYAKTVAESLHGFATSLRIVNLELPNHGDMSDWLSKAGNDKAKLGNIVNNAPEYTPPNAVSREEFDSAVKYIRYLEKRIKTLRPPVREVRKDGR